MKGRDANPNHFDAGRTGLFPGSCLLRGRHPGYPGAQATPHTPALAAVAVGAIILAHSRVRYREWDAQRLSHNGLARKVGSMKSNPPQISWWLRSVTNDDGRRLITLWRGPSFKRNQPRAFQRETGMKLRVQFPRKETPMALPIVSHGGCVAIPDSRTATSGARFAPRPPRQQGPGGPGIA